MDSWPTYVLPPGPHCAVAALFTMSRHCAAVCTIVYPAPAQSPFTTSHHAAEVGGKVAPVVVGASVPQLQIHRWFASHGPPAGFVLNHALAPHVAPLR
eukprot:gene5276-biopygen13246